jgi:hypothetical protein
LTFAQLLARLQAMRAYQKTDLVEFQVDNRLLNERLVGLDVRRWSCFQTRERPSRIPAAIVGGFTNQRFG